MRLYQNIQKYTTSIYLRKWMEHHFRLSRFLDGSCCLEALGTGRCLVAPIRGGGRDTLKGGVDARGRHEGEAGHDPGL